MQGVHEGRDVSLEAQGMVGWVLREQLGERATAIPPPCSSKEEGLNRAQSTANRRVRFDRP